MGSLEDQEHISSDEHVSILRQCISALNYLYNENHPLIVHRDIKPGNILIQHRYVGSIYVKLGDFGLSKDSDYYKTICGSYRYLAPEMYEKSASAGREGTNYTVVVD